MALYQLEEPGELLLSKTPRFAVGCRLLEVYRRTGLSRYCRVLCESADVKNVDASVDRPGWSPAFSPHA